MCAWIPHGKLLTEADVDKAAPLFTKAGEACKAAGLTFMYHTHGYEFVPGPGGTLFDTLASRTDPSVVKFEMDVFWVVRGGGQPLQLLERYSGRVAATHVKDMRKGTPTGDATGSAPEETNVVVGTGVGGLAGAVPCVGEGWRRVAHHRGRESGRRNADPAVAPLHRLAQTVTPTAPPGSCRQRVATWLLTMRARPTTTIAPPTPRATWG